MEFRRVLFRSAGKNLYLVIDVAQAAELVAHAPLGDHAAGHVGGLLDVVAGAGGDVLGAVDQLLGHAPAEHHRQLGGDLLELQAVAVGFRQVHGHAQGAAAGDDGNLVQDRKSTRLNS